MPNSQRNIIINIETKTTQAVNDIKRLNKEITKLQKQNANFKKTTTQVNQMTRSFASLATHLGRLAVIYGAFQGLNNTVRTFAKFEQSMKRLGVVSGATEEELAMLEEKAKSLGETTIYSASQVADGLNAMAMAGLDANAQVSGIGNVLNLASIGMIELEQATLITVRAMNGFGLEAQDIGYITDIMATGATDSAQTIAELGNAYEKVASVATAFGISIEDTTASLELLADAGRTGSEAGTQLKIVMSRLAGNKEALKYIEALGISMYDAEGKLKPFRAQLQLLKTELFKLDSQSRNIKLSEIFGEEGKASAIILLNNLDKYDTKLKHLQNSYGSARQKAKEMQDTLMGAWKELLSALEGLQIKIGSELTPTLVDLIDHMTQFTQTLNPKEIKHFAESVGALLSGLGDVAKVALTVADVLGEMVGSVSDVTGVSSGLVVVLGAMALKIAGVSTALKALALSNPYLLSLMVTLTALDVLLIKLEADSRALLTLADNASRAENAVTDLYNSFDQAPADLNLQETNIALDKYGKVLASVDAQIQNVSGDIDKWSTGNRRATKSQRVMEETLTNHLKTLFKQRTELHQTIDTLKDHGQELQRLRVAYIKLKNASKDSAHQLSLDAQLMSKEQITALKKVETAYKARQVSLEKTLGTMMVKERRYQKELIKLEKELSDVRKDYSNKRAVLNLSLETTIANARNASLNDLQIYNNNQIRADEILARAKAELLKGNLELAKTYMGEYENLIRDGASEEIKVGDEVKRTKKQTSAELIRDAQAGHALNLAIINEEEQREIEAVNAKIASKKLEIQIMTVQIKLQKQMIELVAKILSQASGVEFKPEFSEFNQAVKDADKLLEDLTKKQRTIKIKGDVKDVKKEVDTLDKEKIEPVVEPDTKKAVIKMTGFKKESENSDILVPVNLDTTIALKEHQDLEVTVTEKVEKPMGVDGREAYAENTRIVNELSKDIFRTMYITTVMQSQGLQTGGFVAPRLPRFAGGGDLDSGVGHTRKEGALSGYGGGDKIKALLEAGEFIIRKEAVARLGLDRLHMLNQGILPRYKGGGHVQTALPRFAGGGSVETASSGRTVELNLNIADKTFQTFTDEEVADSLAEYLQRSEF